MHISATSFVRFFFSFFSCSCVSLGSAVSYCARFFCALGPVYSVTFERVYVNTLSSSHVQSSCYSHVLCVLLVITIVLLFLQSDPPVSA